MGRRVETQPRAPAPFQAVASSIAGSINDYCEWWEQPKDQPKLFLDQFTQDLGDVVGAAKRTMDLRNESKVSDQSIGYEVGTSLGLRYRSTHGLRLIADVLLDRAASSSCFILPAAVSCTSRVRTVALIVLDFQLGRVIR